MIPTLSQSENRFKMKAKHYDINADGLDHLDAEFLQDVLIMGSRVDNKKRTSSPPHCFNSPSDRKLQRNSSFPASACSVVTDCSSSMESHAGASSRNNKNPNIANMRNPRESKLDPSCLASTTEGGKSKQTRLKMKGNASPVAVPGSRSANTHEAISQSFSFSSVSSGSGSSKVDTRPSSDVTNGNGQMSPRRTYLVGTSTGNTTPSSPVQTNGMKNQCHHGGYPPLDNHSPHFPVHENHGPYPAASRDLSHNTAPPPHQPQPLPHYPSNNPSVRNADPAYEGVPSAAAPMSYPSVNQGPYSKLMQNKPQGTPLVAGSTTNQGPYSMLVKNTHYTPKLQLPAWIRPNDVLQGDSEMGLSVFSNYCEYNDVP